MKKYSVLVERKISRRSELIKKIKELKPNTVVLFIVSGKKFHETNMTILKSLMQAKEYMGIYITISKPYEVLVRQLKKEKIDVSRLYFIDAISKSVYDKIETTENCIYIPSPQSLTDLAIVISRIVEMMKKRENKFLFLDSLSTLLMYNKPEIVAQFAHFLVTRLRRVGLIGIIISIEKQIDEKLLYLLVEICDKIWEVEL